MMPGSSRNCRLTSSMIAPAVLPTARMASELNRNTSITPSRPPTNTSTLDRSMGNSAVSGDLQALLYLVQVGAEQEEGGQSGRGHGVALGERLGRVAHGVQ